VGAQHGLRFATVTLKVGNQFVSAGQSLKPSEERDGTFQLLVGFGWLVSMLAIGGAWLSSYLLSKRTGATVMAAGH